jgi:peptide/nickel transport system permease protein
MQGKSPIRDTWRMFIRNRAAFVGLVMLSFIILGVVLGPLVYRVDPFDIVAAPVEPPGATETPLGSDYLGRDVLAGLINGGRATLMVGSAAAIFTVVIGILIGSLAGFYGGRVDNLLMRITEFFQVLPPLLLSMVIVALFSPALTTISIAIGLASWPNVARMARAEFLKIREYEFTLAARAMGAGNWRLMWNVILPNATPPLIVLAALTVGVAILFEAGLSFLGLSDPNVMSWGVMIGTNRQYIFSCWWAVTFPGFAIFLTVLTVSLIGDGLNEALNPKLRRRS